MDINFKASNPNFTKPYRGQRRVTAGKGKMSTVCAVPANRQVIVMDSDSSDEHITHPDTHVSVHLSYQDVANILAELRSKGVDLDTLTDA